MFKSFFPRPKLFFLTVVLWSAIAVALWFTVGEAVGVRLGFPLDGGETAPIIGLGYFVTPAFIWFYLYCFAFVGTFMAGWMILAPHPFQWWSIGGSAFIIFADYYQVQASVAINNWRRPFGDAIQNALGQKGNVTAADFYGLFSTFAQIAFVSVAIYVITRFFTSHYVFRWRTAMNNYYMSRWPEVRTIEGASQRVQEDTMRFAQIVEDLGVSMIDSIMTLFAFLPVLAALSASVTALPLIGEVPEPLVMAAIFWSIFGTLLLGSRGLPPAGPELPEPAGRGRLSQGTRLR